jgi:hypothetical protein
MINADEFCPYTKIGTGACRKCLCGANYAGCARYKYSNVRGPENTPDFVGVLDHGRLLELSN